MKSLLRISYPQYEMHKSFFEKRGLEPMCDPGTNAVCFGLPDNDCYYEILGHIDHRLEVLDGEHAGERIPVSQLRVSDSANEHIKKFAPACPGCA